MFVLELKESTDGSPFREWKEQYQTFTEYRARVKEVLNMSHFYPAVGRKVELIRGYELK